MTAEILIDRYRMQPHPEGGHYSVLYDTPAAYGARGAASTILYLLRAGEVSHWHRVDALEIWYFHAGDTLRLMLSPEGRTVEPHLLGMAYDCVPQVIVPAGCWQSARAEGAWTLVGCAVAPAFDFSGFEMAPPEWKPEHI